MCLPKTCQEDGVKKDGAKRSLFVRTHPALNNIWFIKKQHMAFFDVGGPVISEIDEGQKSRFPLYSSISSHYG